MEEFYLTKKGLEVETKMKVYGLPGNPQMKKPVNQKMLESSNVKFEVKNHKIKQDLKQLREELE